jgi:hypothetical protein
MSATLPASPPSLAREGRLRLTPGRRVALVLGVPVVLAIIAFTGFGYVGDIGHASYPVSFTVPISQHTGLTMNLNGGNATLRSDAAATPGLARVTGTVHYSLGRPTLRHNGGDISLACPRIDLGNCDLSATVDLPAAGTPLRVASGGGDVSATGLDGASSLTTDGGDLSLTAVGGVLTVNSGGGDVTADHLGGTPSLTTNGGNINATAIDAGRVTVTSGGGDVTLSFSRAPGNVHVTADGGNVTIIVPPGGHYVVTTIPGGGNVNALPSTSAATNVIWVKSGGGDINIRQSA